MPYIANTEDDRRRMLERIGVGSVDELFEVIPPSIRLNRPLAVPPALSEPELVRHVRELAGCNDVAGICFLGAGAYDHFIPAVVDELASRNEFYTAYTPYQPEASQGSLQAFFEFQSLICDLTGMEVANASLYDGATAAAEATLMALSVTKRYGKVLISSTVHPHVRAVVRTYLQHLEPELVEVPASGGVTDVDALADAVDDQTAAVLVQHPNFFGALEPVTAVGEAAHRAGALFIVAYDPISLGILKRPGDYGADIAVAEGQPLGIPLQYGGPYLGLLSCRRAYVRRMPGRLVGATLDRDGRRCFVLTLQTREQHIRRQKATSNICTNQGLLALRATIYLAALGPQGLREAALGCVRNAHRLAELLADEGLAELAFPHAPFFKEFALRIPGADVPALVRQMRRAGIHAGVPLGRYDPALGDCLLVAVTEKRTDEELHRYVAAFRAALRGRGGAVS